MSDLGEARRCAGLTLGCESFKLYVQTVVADLSTHRDVGSEPTEDYSEALLHTWDTLMQSPDDLEVQAEFAKILFENDFKPEDACINVSVNDDELLGLSQSYPRGSADCPLLSDRIGRVAILTLPE